MNILLMSMPDIFPFHRTNNIQCTNLALASIAGNLDSRHQVGIANLILKRKNVKRAVEKALKRTNPDLVGLSAMTFQYDTALRIARHIKNISPNIKIALGGYHATLIYQEIAESKDARFFDFLFRGESDLSFNEMVDALENGKDMTSVDGLSFKKNSTFIHNKQRDLEDLNKLMLPDRKHRIWKGYHFLGLPLDSIETSRGCYMGCKFCSIRNMYGRSFRKYEISRVIKDIKNARECGFKSLFFTDDNITLDMKRFEELLNQIISSGYNDMIFIIQASSLGLATSEEVIRKMSVAGFKFVFLGIENFSKKNLALFNKGNIAEKSIKVIQMLKKNKIYIIGGLIIGNPDDNFEDIEENYAFATKMGVNIYDQILVPYLKTELRDELLAQNLVTNATDYKLYNGQFANVKTKHLSARQLNFIKYKMVQKYLTPPVKTLINLYRVSPRQILPYSRKQLQYSISLIRNKAQSLFKDEEQLFECDYNRCIKENQFNI